MNVGKPVTLALVLATLAVAGAALDRVAAPVWAAARARQPALRLDPSVTAAGQGVTLALLGGFRALVADAVWIRMYVLWERQDLPGVETLLQLVPTLDPRPLTFWLNGARILAYDFAAWRIAAAGGYDALPEAQQRRIAQEQVGAALRLLERAQAFHPASADLWVERAHVELNALRDPAAAAESYRRAWEQPEAPAFAARLRGELLRRAGRKAEALAWLKQIHPALPRDDAATAVVLERIRDLERELGVPEAERFPGR